MKADFQRVGEVIHPADTKNPLEAVSTLEDRISIKTHRPDFDYPYSKNIVQAPYSLTGNWTITVNVTTDKPLSDESLAVKAQVGIAVRNSSTNEFFSVGAAKLGNGINAPQ